MGIDVRHLSALFVPFPSHPHANSCVCPSRSSPNQGEIIASYGDWMTDGRTLPPFSTLPTSPSLRFLLCKPNYFVLSSSV